MECDLEKFKCVEKCQPVCKNVECGDDGCGGSCGVCEAGLKCVGGKCELACQDECEDGGKGCQDGKPWVCLKDQDGCRIRAYTDCKADEVCAEGLCVPARVPVDGQDDEVTEEEDVEGQDDGMAEEDVGPAQQDTRSGSDLAGRTEELRTVPDVSVPRTGDDAGVSVDAVGIAPKDKEKKKSGCQAGSLPGTGWMALGAGFLLLALWRRRRVA